MSKKSKSCRTKRSRSYRDSPPQKRLDADNRNNEKGFGLTRSEMRVQKKRKVEQLEKRGAKNRHKIGDLVKMKGSGEVVEVVAHIANCFCEVRKENGKTATKAHTSLEPLEQAGETVVEEGAGITSYEVGDDTSSSDDETVSSVAVALAPVFAVVSEGTGIGAPSRNDQTADNEGVGTGVLATNNDTVVNEGAVTNASVAEEGATSLNVAAADQEAGMAASSTNDETAPNERVGIEASTNRDEGVVIDPMPATAAVGDGADTSSANDVTANQGVGIAVSTSGDDTGNEEGVVIAPSAGQTGLIANTTSATPSNLAAVVNEEAVIHASSTIDETVTKEGVDVDVSTAKKETAVSNASPLVTNPVNVGETSERLSDPSDSLDPVVATDRKEEEWQASSFPSTSGGNPVTNTSDETNNQEAMGVGEDDVLFGKEMVDLLKKKGASHCTTLKVHQSLYDATPFDNDAFGEVTEGELDEIRTHAMVLHGKGFGALRTGIEDFKGDFSVTAKNAVEKALDWATRDFSHNEKQQAEHDCLAKMYQYGVEIAQEGFNHGYSTEQLLKESVFSRITGLMKDGLAEEIESEICDHFEIIGKKNKSQSKGDHKRIDFE